MKRLMLSKLKSGINPPDIRKYNLVSILKHSIDWVNGLDLYSNTDLEAALVAPWCLTALLYTKYSALPTKAESSLLLRDTIKAWKA